jgi:hypothetical protein
MRALVNSTSSSDSRSRTPIPTSTTAVTEPQGSPGEDDQTAWAHEEQQMMLREQDRTLDTITGTLATLAQQAGLMGQEVEEHNEQVISIQLNSILYFWLTILRYFRLLDDLERGVDSTDNKLSSAMLKMKKFIRKNEGTPTFFHDIQTMVLMIYNQETKSGWCIIILIIILMALLLAVILT